MRARARKSRAPYTCTESDDEYCTTRVEHVCRSRVRAGSSRLGRAMLVILHWSVGAVAAFSNYALGER